MNDKPYLSVVISAYEEEDNLRRGSLNVVIDYLKAQKFTWEIVIVNDGSPDQTSGLLHAFAAHHSHTRIIDNQHMGKAAGIATGVSAALGEIILFSDMDQATPISEFDKFLPKFQNGYSIVIGSRSGRPNAPVFRKILAYGNVIMRTLILQLPFKDTQCGFKAFTSDAGKKIFSIMTKITPPKVITGPATNPGFDSEMLYLGRKLGYKIIEIPVTWRHQESHRVTFFKDMIAGLTGLLLVRYRSLTNAYHLS